jgi:hypothetical protein
MYKNIFNMSDDEWKLEQAKVINDLKLKFRHEQIETEGNDPVKTGESFGTPHDLATASQQSQDGKDFASFEENIGGAPKGGWPGAGRPKEGGNYATDDNAFGRDPIGNRSRSIKPEKAYNANEVVNKESTDTMLSKMRVKLKTKKIITESLKTDDEISEIGLLDEKNILESDN